MNKNIKEIKVAVIGAGSWGTTLADLLAKKGISTKMYVYETEQYEMLLQSGINEKYLPGVKLHPDLQFSDQLAETYQFADVVLLAVPTHVMRSVLTSLKEYDSYQKIFVSVSKGIENKTLQRMSQVISETLGVPMDRVVALYGPSHAEEVCRGIATAIVAASTNLETARKIREIFLTPEFRVYSSADIIGVELGGSLKNVIAIAAGIADGAGFGDNTKAALMTRAQVEMTRLGVALGADIQTFAGLSGMGDLIVTCMSRHSRNRFVGEQIGKGRTLSEILDEMVMVAEGVKTTESVHQLRQKLNVEMPISEQVYQVLFHDKNPHDAVRDLMTRMPKEEGIV